MNRVEQNKIEKSDRQIRHSEALAEDSTMAKKEMLRVAQHDASRKSFFSRFPFFFSLTPRAFTLSEVLITLGIIGVVAAMTIPTLINNYQKTQYRSAFKKHYSELASAISEVKTDIGGEFDTGFVSSENAYHGSYLRDLLATKFKTVQTCNHPNMSNCWKGSDTVGGNHSVSNTSGMLLNSGWSMIMYTNSFSIVHYPECTGSSSDGTNICPTIYIDVNGPEKLPNRLGLDQFMAFVTKDSLKPGGTAGSTLATCIPIKANIDPNSGVENTGGCAILILEGKDF